MIDTMGSGAGTMAKVMAMARHMSDSQLADVLAGKNMDIPQFAAMTEAMGRKQLRTAVQGAESQQMAHQPSVKDKLLMEHQAEMMPQMAQSAPAPQAGIANLPAPNMEKLASGGIIAFDEGGDVPGFKVGGSPDSQDISDRWQALASDNGEGVGNLLDPIYGFFTNRYNKERRAGSTMPSSAPTDFQDEMSGLPSAAPSNAPINASGRNDKGELLNSSAPGAEPAAPAANPGIPSLTGKAGKRDYTVQGQLDRVNQYLKAIKGDDELAPFRAQLEEQKDVLKAAKEKAGGEAIMNLGLGLLSHARLNEGIASGGQEALKTMRGADETYNKGIQGILGDQMKLASSTMAGRKADLATAIGLENQARMEDLEREKIKMMAPYYANRGNPTSQFTLRASQLAQKELDGLMKDPKTKRTITNPEATLQQLYEKHLGNLMGGHVAANPNAGFITDTGDRRVINP